MAADPLKPHTSTPQELKALNAMQRQGEPMLVWRDETQALQLLALDGAPDRILIGRVEQAGIRLEWDRSLSAVHAELTRLGPEWFITDDGLSANGTFLNGTRITSRCRLRHDDRIVVGSTVLAFLAADAHRPAALGSRVPSTILGGRIIERSMLKTTDWSVLKSLCEPMIFEGSDEPSPNSEIAKQTDYTVYSVKRALTRLYVLFEVAEEPKRRRLAQRAITTGIVRRGDYQTR